MLTIINRSISKHFLNEKVAFNFDDSSPPILDVDVNFEIVSCIYYKNISESVIDKNISK